MSGWIRCIDQEPQKGQLVLAYGVIWHDPEIAVVKYNHKGWIDEDGNECNQGNSSGHLYFTAFSTANDSDVFDITHWMPLPEPPKEDEG